MHVLLFFNCEYLTMIKKCLCLLLMSALVNVRICGQVTQQPSKSLDTLSQQNSNKSNYLKPAALIVPGTLLLYSGLKPFISGIRNLDDDIFTQIKKNNDGFHTN